MQCNGFEVAGARAVQVGGWPAEINGLRVCWRVRSDGGAKPTPDRPYSVLSTCAGAGQAWADRAVSPVAESISHHRYGERTRAGWAGCGGW